MWSGFYSIAVGKPHTITAPIANSPEDIQDIFIDQLVEARKKGDTQRGSFFAALLSDVCKRFNLPINEKILEAMIAENIQRTRRPLKKPKAN